VASLSTKDLEEFVMQLKVFPGHKVKVFALIDQIRRVSSREMRTGSNRKSPSKSASNFQKKRFHSVNTNRAVTGGKEKMSSTGTLIKVRQVKPKSVGVRSNNRIIKSFIEGDGFGFNYFLANKDNEDKENLNNLNSAKGGEITTEGKGEEKKVEKVNQEIDKLLNYYMSQLNEKMEDSFDSLDSSFENINDILNNKKDDKIVINESALKSNPSENKLAQLHASHVKNISDISKISHNNSKDHTTVNILGGEKDKNEKDTPSNIPNPNPNNATNASALIHTQVNSNLHHSINENTNTLQKELTKEEEFDEVKYDDFDKIDEEIYKEEEKIIKETKQVKEDDKSKSKLNESFKNEDKADNDSNDFKNSSKILKTKQKEDNITKNISNSEKISKKINVTDPEEKSILNKNIVIVDSNKGGKIESDKDINEDNDDYSHIRINKSCEEGYLRQNIDQFDIEYMCRCLGLALMKHIETGKEKQHIMELINLDEKFSFFNSVFNVNIGFFNTFFNIENQIEKISNLDKLDLKEYEQKLKKEEDTQNDKKEEKFQPISYVSHMKEDSSATVNNETDLKQLLTSQDDEIKMITDYFRETPNSGKSFMNPKPNPNQHKNVTQNTKNILHQDLNPIKEVDSLEYCKENLLFTTHHEKNKVNLEFIDLLRESAVNFISGAQLPNNDNEEEIVKNEEGELNEVKEVEEAEEENKFNSYNNANKAEEGDNVNIEYQETPLHAKNKEIEEDIADQNVSEKEGEEFESGLLESNYIIDASTAEKLKNYLLKTAEIYDDDYDYSVNKINHRRFIHTPDPQAIFEFCANIMVMTKMEKEVIIICLVYLERFIFNTGLLVNARNWKRLIFTCLIVASKIWDDDSFENNHFAQVFTHLKIGEINSLERSFLELINYKVYVKCSEYFKYFFIIKSIALKYNFNGFNLVPMSVEKMMKLQEYAYQAQKKFRKKYSLANSAQF
jgi:hypothetical protein